MAKGDVAVSLTLPVEIDKLLEKLSKKFGTRREVVIQAVKLLAEAK